MQASMCCLLSWGATAHADQMQPFVPEMVTIPSGSFMMGSQPNEKYRSRDEDPGHVVTFNRPFAVGKYEVTFAEWDYCVADGGCNGHKPGDNGWGRGNRPVIYVSWEDAHAYIDWLNKKTGQQYRLLTEAEWEYAARAGATTTYYWGNDIGQNNANCRDCGSPYGDKQTAPVGSFQPNAFGLHDMLGNVWEWTEDEYHNNYNGAPADGSTWNTEKTTARVPRGGSWVDTLGNLRASNRGKGNVALRNPFNGFRLARTLP